MFSCTYVSWGVQGGGLAYGTKEGRLRIIRHAACAPEPPTNSNDSSGHWRSMFHELVEADQVAAASIIDPNSSDDDP
jgi:hypothetical protein